MKGNYRTYLIAFIIFAILAAGTAAYSYNRVAGVITVAVAARDVYVDEAAAPENVSTRTIPRGAVQKDTILNPAELEGLYAKSYIPSGTVLRKSMFQRAVTTAAKLKPNQVAVAIENSLLTSVGGSVVNGSKVNIISFNKDGTDRQEVALEVEVILVTEKAVVVALDPVTAAHYEEAKITRNIEYELLPLKEG